MARLRVLWLRFLLAILSFPFRSALELVGLAAIVVAIFSVSYPAGLAAFGVALILAANYSGRRPPT